MELRQFFFKTIIVVGTIASLYLLYQVRSLMLLFFIAILFASTVRPAIVKLSERKIPAVVSIPIIYVGFLAFLAGISIVLFPTIVASVGDLLNSQNTILHALEAALERAQVFAMQSAGVQLPLLRVTEIETYVKEFQASAQDQVQGILLDSFKVLSEALILFVLAFYWLTERDRFEELALKMIPIRSRDRFVSIAHQIETTLGAYVRGQTILCLTVGIFAFAVLSLLGVRSALALAVFAALMEAIPMIGPFLGAVPAILIALLDSPEKALLVTVAFVIIQQIEAQVLVPKVMERQVGLSPLFVLLALTAGNLLGGLIGAVVAIPIAAAIKILVSEFIISPTVEARKFPVVEGGSILLDDSLETTSENAEPPPSTPTILTG